MATMEQVPKSYDDAVRVLAHWHGEGGPSDLQIYAIPDPHGELVRLVHVSDTFPDLGGVRIYTMGRSDEFPFRSAIALATRKYWDRIRTGVTLLPSDWDVKTAEEVWPDDRA